MYETPRPAPAPFARNPRSIPLYVPPEPHLPLWPAAWRPGALLRVAVTFAVLLASGAGIIIFVAALLQR